MLPAGHSASEPVEAPVAEPAFSELAEVVEEQVRNAHPIIGVGRNGREVPILIWLFDPCKGEANATSPTRENFYCLAHTDYPMRRPRRARNARPYSSSGSVGTGCCPQGTLRVSLSKHRLDTRPYKLILSPARFELRAFGRVHQIPAGSSDAITQRVGVLPTFFSAGLLALGKQSHHLSRGFPG